MEEKYTRECPTCGKQVEHKTKDARDDAIRKGQMCRKCGCNRPERLKRQSELFSGEKNPFYGKTHSDKTLGRLRGRKLSKEHVALMKTGICSNSGAKNGMYRKSVYSVWLEKDGKEVADQKLNEMKEKLKVTSQKSYNPLTHKSPPNGCGNGWGGWYKGWYFRSLRELSYMINEIESKNIKWESGETQKILIIFKDENGKEHRYFPDFILENKRMVEIKPTRLMNLPKNLLKKTAAEEYCKENGMLFEMTDVEKLNLDELGVLLNDGKITFNKKTQEKFQKLQMRINNNLKPLNRG
jgi:hypothetical protein